MKKKILTGLCVVAFVSAMLLNGTVNMDKGASDVTLSQLMSTPTANAAECNNYPIGGNGKCYELSGNCYWNPGHTECNPW
jgi:hypothetical protein